MKGWPNEPEMAYDVLMAQGPAAAADGRPVTDVIFDFGNVLIYWHPQEVLVSRYSDATIDWFFDNDNSGFYDANDMMDGGCSQQEALDWMRRTHGDRSADIMRYYIDNFEDSLTGVVPGARKLVSDLKEAGIGVWGLSNWDKDLYPLAEAYCPVLSMLDGKVVSGPIGMLKPNRDIYEYALDRFGIDAATSVFIDDKAMNVNGANEAGIRAVRFSDPRRLRSLLVGMGVPIPAADE